MNIELLREYCLSKPDVEETFPFGPDTLVFKTGGKIFAIAGLEGEGVNLKCDPEYALELREKYDEITPGYHMNKKHWNTVRFGTGIPKKLFLGLIDHSYELVRKSLPAKKKG